MSAFSNQPSTQSISRINKNQLLNQTGADMAVYAPLTYIHTCLVLLQKLRRNTAIFCSVVFCFVLFEFEGAAWSARDRELKEPSSAVYVFNIRTFGSDLPLHC